MNRFLFIFFFLNSLIYGYDFIVENEKCKICDIYNISEDNYFWVEYFENGCHEWEEKRKDIYKRLLCYYYDYQLSINDENFYKYWIDCNCSQEEDFPFIKKWEK